MICGLVHGAMRLMYCRDARALTGIRDLRAQQLAKLMTLLRDNADTAFGREHGFEGIHAVEEYRNRVPARDYDAFAPWIERIAAGEKGVLTSGEVIRLVPSSGSVSASKLIPYTQALKDEFQRGLRPWLHDLYGAWPRMGRGRSYWSVTPMAGGFARTTAGGVRIGFEEDTEYFGWLEQRMMNAVFAVPGNVASAATMEEFYRRTCEALLACRDLTLISVWNPTFLMRLLDHMRENAEALADAVLRDLKDGSAASLAARVKKAAWEQVWPNLQVVSCWCDAQAAPHAERLRRLLPHAQIQPKGLLATEGFVTLPWQAAGGAVLSAHSHFFEFESVEDGRMRLADELEPGTRHAVLLSTAGGLYRYRLKDVVEVTGRFGALPTMIFIGKQDKVSDLFGEKLNELFVRDVLTRLMADPTRFAMLAPEGNRYVLYAEREAFHDGDIADRRRDDGDAGCSVESGRVDTSADAAAGCLAERLDAAFRENFHYDWCRRLGQLAAAGIVPVRGDPVKAYLDECVRRGQRLGDIKPVLLHLQGGWAQAFERDDATTGNTLGQAAGNLQGQAAGSRSEP